MQKGKKADLIAANNVVAHVPDMNDFLSGFSLILKDNGVATFEFPHLRHHLPTAHSHLVYRL